MRIPKPFSIQRRNDSKTFLLTLKYTCGLPERVCAEWSRRSFQDLPDELAHYRIIGDSVLLDKPAEIAYIYRSATSRGGLVASGAYGEVAKPPRIFLLQILNPQKIGFLRLGKVKNKVPVCSACV